MSSPTGTTIRPFSWSNLIIANSGTNSEFALRTVVFTLFPVYMRVMCVFLHTWSAPTPGAEKLILSKLNPGRAGRIRLASLLIAKSARILALRIIVSFSGAPLGGSYSILPSSVYDPEAELDHLLLDHPSLQVQHLHPLAVS